VLVEEARVKRGEQPSAIRHESPQPLAEFVADGTHTGQDNQLDALGQITIEHSILVNHIERVARARKRAVQALELIRVTRNREAFCRSFPLVYVVTRCCLHCAGKL